MGDDERDEHDRRRPGRHDDVQGPPSHPTTRGDRHGHGTEHDVLHREGDWGATQRRAGQTVGKRPAEQQEDPGRPGPSRGARAEGQHRAGANEADERQDVHPIELLGLAQPWEQQQVDHHEQPRRCERDEPVHLTVVDRQTRPHPTSRSEEDHRRAQGQQDEVPQRVALVDLTGDRADRGMEGHDGQHHDDRPPPESTDRRRRRRIGGLLRGHDGRRRCVSGGRDDRVVRRSRL